MGHSDAPPGRHLGRQTVAQPAGYGVLSGDPRGEFNAEMIARTNNLAAAMVNHWALDGGDPIRPRLGDIAVPALVLHGTEDPLFPPGHAEALAREVPGARLVLLEGAGHELPEQVWDVAIAEILAISDS